jgi:serine/threonine protein kinase
MTPCIATYAGQVRCDSDGSLAIVMEYVEGASLRERLSVALETRTPIPEEETWRILLQVYHDHISMIT